MADPALELVGIEKRFAGHQAVSALNLQVEPGEFVTLLGPSGCGKSTTLNMIAGFLTPDRGSIRLAGRPVETLAPFRRDLGIVFQDYALFPHRTVAENVAFGLRMRKVNRAEIARRTEEAITMVRLDGLGSRYPLQLSGGQRQRVALARALVIRPALLLLDEPLSNLDLKLREEMRTEISALQRRLGIATVFVTHDQDEALTMSDRIAVMRRGRIEQLGTARDIYERPASAFVATFIGSTNMIRAEVLGVAEDGQLRLLTPMGDARVRRDCPVPETGGMLLTVRPERLRLSPRGEARSGATVWRGRVERVVYLGSRSEVHLVLADGSAAMVVPANEGATPWEPGDEADAWFMAEDAWTVPAEPLVASS
jgi:putative spermidine/putrescine transport system ATP-binding protein